MESIIITYPEIKKSILKNRKTLVKQKVMNMNELLSKLLFSYDERAIYYLMKKYNFKYEVAIIYLNNIINLLETDSNLLNDIKNDLLEQGLLIIDEHFRKNIKHSEITIYHYPMSKWEEYILKKYQCNYKIEENENITKKYCIYRFKSIEEEVNFIALQIIDLLNSKIDINNIKLTNVLDEYKPYISRIFDFYNIPFDSECMLASKGEVISFVNELKESKNIESSLSKISDINIKKNIVQIINKYAFIKEIDDIFIEIIMSELKKINIKLNNYENKIEVISHPTENDIVFVLGFNDSFPKFEKDEDFLSDEVKKSLNMDTSTEKNNIIEKQLLQEFSAAKKIYFTYSTKVKGTTYQISPISEKFDYDLLEVNNDTFKYSDLYNKIKLAKMLDEKNKFNIISPNLSKLYNHYKNIDYQNYNNQFKGISKLNLYKFLNNKIVLSYSSIDNYYKCGFRFYLNNILKITPFEETFAIKIGNIFHHILEKYNIPNFDYETEFNKEISNLPLTPKEKIFIKKLKQDLKFIIEVINKHNKFSTFIQEDHEKKIYINKDKTISVTFMGVIDKIKYTNKNGKTLLAIIDYKTGSPITNLTKTLYGLDMQLPIYLYLASHVKEFSNIEVVGIYLQKVLNNELTYDPKKDYLKQKEDQLKLEGYSIDNEELISLFDSTYKDSEMIKGMKTSKNGFYAYTKIITKKQLENLYNLVDYNIDKARDHILEADFRINPKKMETENTCKFCPYSDICHKKEEDYIEIDIPNNLDFLNEVDYAKMD